MAPIRTEATDNDSDVCIMKTVYEDGIMVTRYQCALCSGSVSRKSDFPRHMRQHTREGLIMCPVKECDHPGFTQLGNWKTHYSAKHDGKRHVCPHLWIDADGEVSACSNDYSDTSGLIRHRSLHHGFEAGDDVAKIQIPTLEGTTFPNSKYARGNKRKADGDDLLSLPTHSQKRTKRTPAPSSSGRSPKKPTSRKPASVQVQQIDWSPMSTTSSARPSEAHPYTASDSCSSGGLFNPEPQTAAVNKWVFPPTTHSSFDFVAEPLMTPAPIAPPTADQANLAGAGLASPPEFYHPGRGNDSMDSSRESSVFNGYYGL